MWGEKNYHNISLLFFSLVVGTNEVFNARPEAAEHIRVRQWPSKPMLGAPLHAGLPAAECAWRWNSRLKENLSSGKLDPTLVGAASSSKESL